MYQTKCQPSEIGNMPYWKFEAFIERLNKKNQEETDRQKKQQEAEKKQNQSQNKSSYNPSKYVPKMPRMKY
jgi:TPP-dependent 2-oxoacid decarboxylase